MSSVERPNIKGLLSGMATRREADKSKGPERQVLHPDFFNAAYKETLTGIFKLLKSAEPITDEAQLGEIYVQLQKVLLPFIAEHVDRLDQLELDAEISGVPLSPALAQEKARIEAQLDALTFIYAGEKKDIKTILAELQAATAAPPEAPVASHDHDSGGHGKHKETKRDLEKLAGNLPNDFFRFLLENGVNYEDLMGPSRDALPGESSDDHEKRIEKELKEKYRKLGNIFFSILISRMDNDITFSSLTIPALHNRHIGNFELSKSDKNYDAAVLLETAAALTETKFPTNEKVYAEEMIKRILMAFNVMDAMNSSGSAFISAADNLDSLARIFYPFASEAQKQSKLPTSYDAYFWFGLLGASANGTGAERGPLEEINFMYPDHHHPGEWKEEKLSLTEQILKAYVMMKRAARFPGQSRNLKVNSYLTNQRRALFPGTSSSIWRDKSGHVRRKAKAVSNEVTSPGTALPLFEETVVIPERQRRHRNIQRSLSESLAKGPNESPDTTGEYVGINVAKMLYSWWNASLMDRTLKPRESWEVLFGVSFDKASENGLLQRAVTIADQSVNLGPDFTDPVTGATMRGLNIDGYGPGSVLNNITLMQKWVLTGEVKPYTLGTTAATKVGQPDFYAAKTLSDKVNPNAESGTSDSTESQFPTKVIGMIKGLILPFDRYFYNYELGMSFGEILEKIAEGNRDYIRHILPTLGSDPTKLYSNFIKDELALTKYFMEGLKSGSPVKIATVDIEKGLISDINGKLVGEIRGLYRIIKGYQYETYSRPPKKVEKDFFAGVGPYDNLGNDFIVVKTIDHKTKTESKRLLRSHEFYHIDAQTLFQMVHGEAITANGNASAKRLSQKFRGVPVFEIVVDDASKVFGFGNRDGTLNREAFANGYTDMIMMRHIMAVFMYHFFGDDELQHLDADRRLLFGLVFSQKLREDFQNRVFTGGPVINTFLETIEKIPGVTGLLGEEFFENEQPDIAGPDIITTFDDLMEFFIRIGWIPNAGDNWGAVTGKSSSLFGGGKKH